MEADESGLLGELGGGEGVAAIERGLRDLAGKVLANPDVQNLGDSIRTGAMKVSSPYVGVLCRMTNGPLSFVVIVVRLFGTHVSGAMSASLAVVRAPENRKANGCTFMIVGCIASTRIFFSLCKASDLSFQARLGRPREATKIPKCRPSSYFTTTHSGKS